MPESFRLKQKQEIPIPYKTLVPIDTAYLLEEEKINGIPNRYGIVQHVLVNIKKEGIATQIEGKGTIWRYELKALQANSIGIRFSSFHLPEGASVFIYNEDHTQRAGAFTSIDNLDTKLLPIADFKGQNAIIEYFEPLYPSFPGELVIGSVALAYKNIFQNAAGRIGINCPAGANWQDVKHSVCLISFNDSLYLYYCTGFLINNIREDGSPYFQTASHCLNTNSLAETMVAYFNYENPICSNDSVPFSPSLAGATVISSSSFSDFTLLMLNQYPPQIYLPYYAGWNANIEYAKSGTCIHHPSGAPKCIAVDTLSPRNYPYTINWQDLSTNPVSEPGTHWEAIFNIGSVEGGSSGAPLFNENQLVIGQLHGGSNNDDYFGKFALSWDHNNLFNQQLKHWLDPDSTGILSLSGSYIPRKPRALFSTRFTHVCNGTIIKFINLSKYSPLQWKWSITPSSFQFVNGTNSGSKNPEAVFNEEGNYTITLIATNSLGSDTMSQLNYIHSIYTQAVISGLPADNLICGCNLNSFSVKASGADRFNFNIERTDKIGSKIYQDSLILTLNPGESKYGSFSSWLKVTGIRDSCITSDSVMMQISMPVNDNIENAIQLGLGRNSGYTNFCASVQQNEPHPLYSSCFSSKGWCQLSGSPDSVLKNTIWFRFLGPSGGIISIDTHGFNDRIALYEAENAGSILSGNPQEYKLLAANDGRSASDASALLENIPVVPYKNYWLQLDGVNNATGECTIDLLTNSIEVSPNPSSGLFNIVISNITDGKAEVKIFSPVGTMVYSNSFMVSVDANHFSFDLSSLAQGMYFMQAKVNGVLTKTRLMIIK